MTLRWFVFVVINPVIDASTRSTKGDVSKNEKILHSFEIKSRSFAMVEVNSSNHRCACMQSLAGVQLEYEEENIYTDILSSKTFFFQDVL